MANPLSAMIERIVERKLEAMLSGEAEPESEGTPADQVEAALEAATTEDSDKPVEVQVSVNETVPTPAPTPAPPVPTSNVVRRAAGAPVEAQLDTMNLEDRAKWWDKQVQEVENEQSRNIDREVAKQMG